MVASPTRRRGACRRTRPVSNEQFQSSEGVRAPQFCLVSVYFHSFRHFHQLPYALIFHRFWTTRACASRCACARRVSQSVITPARRSPTSSPTRRHNWRVQKPSPSENTFTYRVPVFSNTTHCTYCTDRLALLINVNASIKNILIKKFMELINVRYDILVIHTVPELISKNRFIKKNL